MEMSHPQYRSDGEGGLIETSLCHNTLNAAAANFITLPNQLRRQSGVTLALTAVLVATGARQVTSPTDAPVLEGMNPTWSIAVAPA
jgi:hypothetical protein